MSKVSLVGFELTDGSHKVHSHKGSRVRMRNTGNAKVYRWTHIPEYSALNTELKRREEEAKSRVTYTEVVSKIVDTPYEEETVAIAEVIEDVPDSREPAKLSDVLDEAMRDMFGGTSPKMDEKALMRMKKDDLQDVGTVLKIKLPGHINKADMVNRILEAANVNA